MPMQLPLFLKVGDDVYIPSAFYIDRGQDDRVGGLAEVTSIKPSMSAGKMVPFITVKEIPGVTFNWQMLSQEQEKLKAQFGNSRAYPDPDLG